MSHRPADPCLLSLAPDTMDALRFARWHGSLPDLDGLEADIRTLQPAGVPPRPLAAAKPWHDTMAACLEPQTVVALRARYGAALCIEPDASFRHQAAPMGARGLPAPAAAGIRPEGTALHFRVTDPEGAPIAGARLWAEGTELDPGVAVLTDADGMAVLPLATENPAAVRRLAVLPAARYWARHLVRPVLRVTPPGATPRVNRLVLRPLRSPLGALPDWGSEAMGLDRAPLLTVTAARPVRVAILDPGAPAALPFTIASLESEALVEGWSPAVAPPSSAAGLIAAAAPGARVDVLHVGTEPRASALIAAIGWCLSAGIDLLDFGFATPAPCEALAATLARARAQGLVVIAPAGDSSGPVLYPAAERETLAVGAITTPGACPHDAPGASAAAIRGVVLAGFSARGAALDLVAPGTGIVLPGPDGPVAMEGTSLASALVTGFLARLLQTEDDLAGAARCRARADALQAMLRARCRAAGLAAGEGGAGLPLWDPLGTPGTTPDECPSLAARARRGPLAAARLPA